jgi:acyl transferase domain-containing protein/3-hydroxymyristoyl/3-hydroxydecanoyl-(acyl carrier protein) dehydratase
MPDLPRVAIVGIGGLFPAAASPERLWDNILAAADAARDVPPGRWLLPPEVAFDPAGPRPDRVYSRRGCFLDPFTLDRTGLDLAPELLAELDVVFHLALHAGRQAWQAGVTHTLDRRRVGVILGNIALPTEKASALARHYLGRTFAEKLGAPFADGPPPHPLNRHVTGLPAGVLAKALGLGGGSFTLDAACATSLYAIKLAVDELQAGRADAMLAGGVSRPDCLYTQMGFSQLRALSPSGRCSPFDARADGLVVGEGAGVFLLKRFDDAVRDGDRMLAVIAGIGLSNDIGGGLLAPNSDGQLRAMRAAYRAADWSPHDVDLIECHATGTPVGDAVEVASLKALWGERLPPRRCVLGSVKSTVGHLLTAAGAAAVTKVLFALQAETLPPTANFDTPAPGLGLESSPFEVLRRRRAWERRDSRTPRRAAVSAFGFGGINAHLLLEEPAAPTRAPRVSTQRQQVWTSKHLLAPRAPAVAVVAMGAHFGPWSSPAAFRARALGGAGLARRASEESGESAEPQPPRRWWGVPESAWFRREDLPPFAGFYIDAVTVAAERYRIPPRELEEMLPQQLLLLNVAADVFDSADEIPEQLRRRTGVYIGLNLDLNTTNFHFRWSVSRQGHAQPVVEAAGPALSANRTMGALASIAASRVAREFRLGGPSFTVSSEESSGLRALELAARALQRGEIDAALVGAVDLAGDVRSVLAEHRLRLSDAAVGEGAAAVLLKRLADVRSGERVRAILRGIGVAGGMAADGPGEAVDRAALERAFDEAAVDPATVGYVDVSPDVGHAGAAAGLSALVKACLCLEHHILLPGQTAARCESGRALVAGPRSPTYWLRDRAAGPRRAAVRACGVDGNCVHVVLEESATATARAERWLGPLPEALFVVEGADPDSLVAGLEQLRARVELSRGQPIERLARTWMAAVGGAAWGLASSPSPPAPLPPKRGERGEPDRGLPGLAVCLVARDAEELLRQIDIARNSLARDPEQPLPAPGAADPAFRDRIFYSPNPLGPNSEVAFVYPGSGNDFAGMGRDLAVRWPEVLRRQDAENELLASQYLPDRFWRDEPRPPSVRQRLFAQVALGTLVTDLLQQLGVRPQAAIGYSLGESSALFALRAWADRDGMLRRMTESSLFASDLAGPCDAARAAWGVSAGRPVEWLTAIVDRPADEVRAALTGLRRAYLLLVNTPRECVVGGLRAEVTELAYRLGCALVPVPETTTMHCPAVRPVAEAYRALHHLPTTPPAGVRFYSGALGRAYEVNADSAAEAILAQALDAVDFPALIESAYRDGVRLFVEVGPGASCSRMTGATLGERPHRARAACVAGADGVSTLLRLLAQLIAERVPVDLQALYGLEEPTLAKPARPVVVPVGGEPFVVPAVTRLDAGNPANGSAGVRLAPRVAPAPADLLSGQLAGARAVLEAQGAAHGAYLRFSDALRTTWANAAAFQGTLLEALAAGGNTACGLAAEAPALDRNQCLEFATGSIARILGPDFAEVDAFPTRVRLPDEPLMLVDRILTIEAEPRSLTRGRVVTEHDVHPGAWYLDAGRIPTCIAVEAGQADLFLSAFLGIDFRTRGLAVYRLLDAAVTFHRGLPGPGETIRYDIHIDRFFRQGDTHLFRFRFEGSVGGEPLLSMTDGCAGFFTAADLAAGRGVVQTDLDRRPRPSVRPQGDHFLPAIGVESYDERQVDSLRRGDLAGCFGGQFARLPLREPLRPPGGRMKLVDRVTRLDPDGGRFGVGLIRAEADVHADDWFLTCHFIDDQVMPGTLMYECCLHTLRIFLMRLGWVGEQDEVVCEPVPGVASRLKCRGQVTAATRTVTYEVTLKERGYRPEPYAVVDALMYADGKPIVDITDMSIRLSGLTREALAALWGRASTTQPPNHPTTQFAFGPKQVLAFAVGKPSEAFGERYRPFDEGRFIARLPGPPYSFLRRARCVDGRAWDMAAPAAAVTEYDVPPDAWYFAAERAPRMPFAVLQEVALQSCGWLAAHLGSALTSPEDLRFRNLGGRAELLGSVGPDAGTLTTEAHLTRVSRSAGMIIQEFDFILRSGSRAVYRGSTHFGFFTRDALANQVGIRDAKLHPAEAGRMSFEYPRHPPFPDDMLRMIDRVELDLDGGPQGLGFAQGTKLVRPGEWYFAAHFFQDPVWPGSLGLEALVQLLKLLAAPPGQEESVTGFEINVGGTHQWAYRGQVIPTNREVAVQAVVTSRSDGPAPRLAADGLLAVDGLVIYRMSGFTVRPVLRR